jgi:acetyl-CoA C-acetyltransferase
VGGGDDVVVAAGARTPFGRFLGGLSGVSATDLGGRAIAEAVRRAAVPSAEVDYVFMGMVVQAGAGQIPSRQATMAAGLPVAVPSDTINKVCASGLRACNLGALYLRQGEGRVVVGGGMESMSNAPFLLGSDARRGMKMGDRTLVDAVVHDGLTCAFGHCHMGVYGSEVAKEFAIGRPEQDEWALRSHRRAAAAQDAGRFAEEIVSVEVAPARRTDTPQVVTVDESIRRDTSLERLAALPPAFAADGSVTAGNAPGLSDGAAALVLMTAAEAERRGAPVLGRIVAFGSASAEPRYLHTVPWLAAERALQRAGLARDDVALWEINEAFAAVTLTSVKLGGIDPERVNVNGGAVALGHPVGASGARLLLTLLYELRRRGGGYGVASLCSGGGQGEATVVRVD